MTQVWLAVDAENEIWTMKMVSSKGEATLLSSGNAQQATRGADQKFPQYRWKMVGTPGNGQFIVQGSSR